MTGNGRHVGAGCPGFSELQGGIISQRNGAAPGTSCLGGRSRHGIGKLSALHCNGTRISVIRAGNGNAELSITLLDDALVAHVLRVGAPGDVIAVGIHLDGIRACAADAGRNVLRNTRSVLERAAIEQQAAGPQGMFTPHDHDAAAQHDLAGKTGVVRIDGQLAGAGLFQIAVSGQGTSAFRGIPYIIRRLCIDHDDGGRNHPVNRHRLGGIPFNVTEDDALGIRVYAAILPGRIFAQIHLPGSIAAGPGQLLHLFHNQGQLVARGNPPPQQGIRQGKGVGGRSGNASRTDQVIGTRRPRHSGPGGVSQQNFFTQRQGSGHGQQGRAGRRKSGKIQNGGSAQCQIAGNGPGRPQGQISGL